MSSVAGVATGGPGDAGADLAAAAVAAMSSTGFVRAAADAVELHAIATLAQVRRQQAVSQARSRAREADRARGLTPGTTRPVRVDVDKVDRFTAQEVSLALTLSPVIARDRLELAVELLQRRPVTFQALQSGQVDLVRARRICDALRNLPGTDPAEPNTTAEPDADDLAAQVEAEVLHPGSVPALTDRRPARPAGELTPAQLTARLTTLVLRVDPLGATDRTALADTRRGCSLRNLPDGMALLSITGRTELLSAAFTRLDTTARDLLRADARGQEAVRAAATAMGSTTAQGSTATAATTPDPAAPQAVTGHDAARTLDQTRVDVFLATLLGTSDDLTRAHNVHIDLALVATAGTVLAGGDEPGDLDGYGPISTPLTRALAADARWRRWDTDPTTGHITATTPSTSTTPSTTDSAGSSTAATSTVPNTGPVTGCGAPTTRHSTYRPSTAVADLIRARDRTCRFPTCRRRATACDLDHVTPYPHGPTCHTTMATECRLHHTCKHQAGFTLTITPDGTTTWTTPTGQHLTTHPPSWGRPPPRPAEQPTDGQGADDHDPVDVPPF